MDETKFLDAIGRLNVNDTIEYRPTRRRRIEYAKSTSEARRKVSELTGTCGIRITRTRTDQFLIHISSVC